MQDEVVKASPRRRLLGQSRNRRVVPENKRNEVGGGGNPYENRKQEQKHAETAPVSKHISETPKKTPSLLAYVAGAVDSL